MNIAPPTIHEDLDLLIVDLDGTIRTCTVEGQPCPNKPGEQALIPAAVRAMNDADGCGLTVIGATNQGGIGLGFMSEEDHRAVTMDLREMLREQGEGLTMGIVYVCPHRPDAGCSCRKPLPELLLRACSDNRADHKRVLFVGDRPSDRLAAEAAGVRFMWAHEWHALFAPETP